MVKNSLMSIENDTEVFPRPVKVTGNGFSDGLISNRAQLAAIVEEKTRDLTPRQQRKLVGALYNSITDLLSGRRPKNMIDVPPGTAGHDRITHYLLSNFPKGFFEVAIGLSPGFGVEPELEIISLGLVVQSGHDYRKRKVGAAGQKEIVKFKIRPSRRKFH